MKKLAALLLLAILAAQVSAGLEGSYRVTVLENGNAQVLLSLAGTGTINVPLPLDVSSPDVDGALYLHAPNGIDLFVGTTRHASLGYESALLTTKAEAWNFEMLLPNLDRASIIVSMPKNVEIVHTSPNASVIKASAALELRWNLSATNSTTIAARYRFVQAQNETTEPPAPQPAQASYALYALAFTILLAAIGAYLFALRKPKEIKPSSGAENVMKTLTDNELLIVKLLLAHGGGMKRNKLERESKLAKSSLASALYRLEQRSIVKVDKTSAVHYVELTEWFRGL